MAQLRGIEVGLGKYGNAELRTKLFELFDGCRAVDVGGNQHRFAPVREQVCGELGTGSRLASTLQADHHDGGVGTAKNDGHFLHWAEKILELGVADEDKMLPGRSLELLFALLGVELYDLTDSALLDAAEKGLDDTQLDIGLEERDANLPHRFVDVLFC